MSKCMYACSDLRMCVQGNMRYLQVYFERNELGSEGVAIMCKVCMYVCMYVCMCMHVCMLPLCARCVFIYVCMYVCINTHTHKYMHIDMLK